MSTLYVRDLIWMVQREYEANQCPYAENFLSQVKFLCERLGDIEVAVQLESGMAGSGAQFA